MGSGTLVPIRTEGGSLRTGGLRKTEEFRKESDSWRGTTTSGIRLDATYRYDIELRDDWRIHINRERGIVFVVAPPYEPALPVAVDSESLREWTESGWGRFDKWDHLQELRREISPMLEKKAKSEGYRELARGTAKTTVEEFVADWVAGNRDWPEDITPVVRVHFADEDDIPYPEGRSLGDFLP